MSDTNTSSNAPQLPKRPYGRSGEMLSILGLGGIVVMNAEQDDADRIVAEAVERGVNYFDVAPGYGDAEIKLGPALQPFRKNVFLACKTSKRQGEPALEELERSLQQLRTDHFDLYQLHGLCDVAGDVDAAFASDGVMPMLIEQHKAGRIRHLGFSAHSVEAAMAAMDRYDFDSILWPTNFACYFTGGFGPQVVEAALEKGMAVLALKAMARQLWPETAHREQFSKCWYQPLNDPRQAELALRFTLSQGVTALLPPGAEPLFRLALDLITDDRAITPAEVEELRELATELTPIFQTA